MGAGSSGTISRLTTRWPASSAECNDQCTRTYPFPACGVSETVKTARFNGPRPAARCSADGLTRSSSPSQTLGSIAFYPVLQISEKCERSIVGRRVDVLEYARRIVHPAEECCIAESSIVHRFRVAPTGGRIRAASCGGSTMLRACRPWRCLLTNLAGRPFDRSP